jgi:hypothetical protein
MNTEYKTWKIARIAVIAVIADIARNRESQDFTAEARRRKNRIHKALGNEEHRQEKSGAKTTLP